MSLIHDSRLNPPTLDRDTTSRGREGKIRKKKRGKTPLLLPFDFLSAAIGRRLKASRNGTGDVSFPSE